MRLFFDLDLTLVDSREARPYLKTREGKQFIVDNIDSVETWLVHPVLLDIVKSFARRRKVKIVTNSPGRYAHALMRKHGFPDIPILGSANKPFVKVPFGSVIVGDHAVDVLTAHRNRVRGIAVSWGYSNEDNLESSEPHAIVDSPEDLEDVIIDCERGDLGYVPMRRPGEFKRAGAHIFDVLRDDRLLFLDTYFPVSAGGSAFSGRVLSFKEAKNYSFDEISSGARELFFHRGEVRAGVPLRNILNDFFRRVSKRVSSVPGRKLVVGAPNSLPEFCYRFDLNAFFAEKLSDVGYSGRLVYRADPVNAAHGSGSRGALGSLGVLPDDLPDFSSVDSVVIFDDVYTSGSQVRDVASLIIDQGFSGNIYAVVLGRTVSDSIRSII